MDWMTLSIELVGLLILCIWIIVPISEFKEIIHKLRPRGGNPREGQDDQ